MGGLRCLSIEATILTLQASLNVIDWCMQLLQFVFSPLPHLFSRRTHSKDIVIVGASFGGLAALQELKGRRDVRVTLVDFKEYFEYTPGVLRCFIEPEYLSKLTCELPRKMNTLVIGEVTGVSATAVEVRQPDGTAFELSFDYLVLACGSTYQQVANPEVTAVSGKDVEGWGSSVAQGEGAGGWKNYEARKELHLTVQSDALIYSERSQTP